MDDFFIYFFGQAEKRPEIGIVAPIVTVHISFLWTDGLNESLVQSLNFKPVVPPSGTNETAVFEF